MAIMTQEKRADIIPFAVPETLGDVRAWSYSALKVFEECPYRTYISKVKGVREPSNPAADRGTQIHNYAEEFVDGRLGTLPDSLKKFEAKFLELRELYIQAKVELEGDWAFTLEWEPTAWVGKDTWARIKLDALVHQSEESARVIDYKTGRKWGNEMAHGQQGLLYAIATFFRYPKIQFVQTEFWYLDKNEITKKQFTRAEAMLFAPGFHHRGVKMTTCTDFEPTPSASSCKWCKFKEPIGDDPAQCTWGVIKP